MKKRILSLFLAVTMILSAMTMLGISATAETITATEAGNNVLHVTNSNHTDKFWSKVLVNLDSGISNGYIEFDIRTENIESSAWLDLLVEAANGSYKQLTIRQENGKYHFKKEAGSTQFKEVVLGTWHHVKFVIKNNNATVEIDGVPFTSLNGALNAPVTILNFQLSKPGNYDFYIDNVKAVNSDGTVVFEQDFDDDTVGNKPSGFDIAVRSGHNLDSTTVDVVNAVPLLNEQKTLHFVGKSGAGNKAVTATYTFTAVTNADIEFDYTPIAMGSESNCRQGLLVGGASIGVVNSALRVGDITNAAYNVKSGVKTVTLGETYHFKLTVDEAEGSKLYVNGQLCSGDGDSKLAAVKSVNEFYFYLDHVQDSASEMKIDNVKITKHGTGEVIYNENFDKLISGTQPTGWTIGNGNPAKLSILVAGTTPTPEDGNILRIEDNTSDAVVHAIMELEERSKAHISFSYKAEKLTAGHIFAIKDKSGSDKVVLRAMPITEKTAKLQYQAENGEFTDIEKSEFNIGAWNKLEITVYNGYGKADVWLDGVELGEVYSNIGVDKFTSLEMGSASVEGVEDTFCVDSISVTSDNVPGKIPTASSMTESKTVAAGSSLSYNFEKACSGRFTFELKSSNLSGAILSLLGGEKLGTQIKIGADGGLYYLRDSIWMLFTNAGVVDPDDGKSHTVVLDVPLERNVGYINVFVDGSLVGTAFYNLSYEEISGLRVTAPSANSVTVSFISVGASQGIFATPDEEEKTVSPYYSEVISGTRGMYALEDTTGTASMQYFDEGDLESVTLDVNKNSIGIDLGSTQKVNTLRIRFKDVNDELINYTSGQKAMWSAMIVYVSNDNVNFTKLGPTSRNTVNDGSDVIMSFDFSGVEARYVKINYQHTKTENGLLTALAENASVSATRRITRQWAMAGDVIYMANDIAPTSSSLNEVNDATAPITLKKNSSVGINFGLVSNVEAVELIGNGTQNLDASDFVVYYSVDNVSYAKINVTSVSRDTRNGQPVLRFNFDNIKATHIKINAVSDVSVSLESAMGGVAAYSSVEASSSTTYLTHVAGRGAEGGFFTCDDGTLVMCHIEYDSETHGDEAPAHISIRRSTDGGVTWTKSETFLTKLDETSLNVFVPTFVKLNDGKVGMVFMEKFASGASSVYIITSDDEGKTWSERRKIAYTDGNIGYFCLSSGSPAYKAPNGRILVSFAYSVYENEAYGSDRCYGYVVYSDDNGETWIRSKNSFTVPEGVMEPAMSATPDGKLIMTMTTRKIGLIYRSISEDNGETWSQPVPLQEGFCTSHLTQGHVLIPGTDRMVYICVNDLAVQNGSKTPLISAITADNGASYHNIRHITEGVGAGSSWPVVKIYGRKVIIQNGFNTITVRTFDIAELFHSVTGDISTLPKAATPTAVYNEDTRTLSGLNADIAFSLDGGKTWSYAGGSEVVFEQSHIAKARKILVKNIGNTEYAPSDIQELEAHDFVGDTCQKCGATCPHELVDGACKYCGTSCIHKFSFSIYTGLYSCDVCGELCKHSSFTNDLCNACGIKCVHDWKYAGNTSTCAICNKTCSNHQNLGLDFKCTICGVDTGKSHSFSEGASFVYDNYFTLEKYHNASVSFDFTVGEAYYDNSTKPNNTSDYHSLLTFIRNNAEYHVFASLWMDQESGKLYLTKSGSSATKICEIEQGVKYGINVDFKPTSGGAYTVTVTKDGAVIGTLNNNFGGFSATQKSASLRFGEAVNAKYLRVNNVAFDNIEITTEPYVNGVCTECGKECSHVYNIGGHCHICGVLGDPITFKDGKNGGGNVVDTVKNAQTLTVGNGVYSQNNGEYRQCWDFRDTEGILLGHDYVFEGKFTFNEFVHDPNSKNGITNLLIWSNGDVGVDNNKFFVLLYTDNGKLELGVSATERMELTLGKEYDIRVAIRSDKLSGNSYSNRAEIYVNGKLMWTKSFALTAENGMSIRLGDHVARTSKVKYDVKNDFGIHFIDSSIEYIGSQEKENANYNYDSSYDIRFIFGIDDLYLSDVGVKVEAEMSGGSMYDEVSGEMTISSSRTVLTEIMADGKVCKPVVNGAGGGNYLALAINDIPLDTGATYTFTLTPYVTYNTEETVFSKDSHKITVSFTDYKMNIAYEK